MKHQLEASIPFVLPRTGRNIRLDCFRSNRKTICLKIGEEDDVVQVAAPHLAAREEIFSFVCRKEAWLCKWLDEKKAMRAFGDDLWADAATILWWGEACILHLQKAKESSVRKQDSGIWVKGPDNRSQADVLFRYAVQEMEGWLQRDGQKILDHFLRETGRRPKKIIWVNVRSFWGNCRKDGVIRLNLRLLNLNKEHAALTLYHELCHLLVRDHSPRFYELLACFVPEHKVLRRKKKGFSLDRLPFVVRFPEDGSSVV